VVTVFFVVGGNCTGDVYIFNGTWTKLDTSKSEYIPGSVTGGAVFAINKTTLVSVGGRPCAGGWTVDVNRLTITGQTGVWTKDFVEGFIPVGRDRHTIVLDTTSKNTSFVLFGGRDQTNNPLQDVWQYDLQARIWTQLGPPTPGNLWPSPRSDHSAVWGKGRMLIFGGQNTTNASSELWQFILNGDCFQNGDLCQNCVRPGCGWCQANLKAFQCVAGLSTTGAYDTEACQKTDEFVFDTEECEPLFPGWIISLIIIGCIVVLGVIVYMVMRQRNPEYQQL